MHFKLIFISPNNEKVSVDYRLANNDVAREWYRKIKHLKNIKHDVADTTTMNCFDLRDSFEKIKSKYGIDHEIPSVLDQKALNHLHEIFEQLCQQKHDHGEHMRTFHHSIHQNEARYKQLKKYFYMVGWGEKEGPLTTVKLLHPFYADQIEKGHIYSIWAELGKRPENYYADGEPDRYERVMALCKPHITFRAKFTVALKDKQTKPFSTDFVSWFGKYKPTWLSENNLESWLPRDEQSGVLLATCLEDVDWVDNIKDNGYTYHKIETDL